METFIKKPWVKALAITVAIVLVLWIIFLARAALAPFVIAFGLAYLLDPVIDKMETLKLGRVFSIMTLLSILLLGFLAVMAFLAPLAASQLEAVAKKTPVYIDRMEKALAPIISNITSSDDGEIKGKIRDSLKNIGDIPLAAIKAVASGIWSGISGAMGIVVAVFNLAIIPVVTFYLLKDFDHIMAWGALRVPPRSRERVYGLAKRLDSVLSGFLRGQMMVAMIMATILSIGLLIIGVPMGFLLGALAGLANIVPFMPVVVGYTPAMALVYADGGGIAGYVWVSLLFGGAQALEGFVITPKIQGEAVGLHPVAIMAATLVGGVFFGFIGVLLAAPAAAVLKVFLEDLDQAYMESTFYSGKSAPRKK